MTTFAAARQEAIDGLIADGVRAVAEPFGDPPYVYVTFDGGDPEQVMRGAVTADYRFVLVGGGWEEAGAAKELDALRQSVVEWLRDTPGWVVGSIGRDGGREWMGATYLTADVGGSRAIDV